MTGNRGPFPPGSTRLHRVRLNMRLVRDAVLTAGLIAAVPLALAGLLAAVAWLWGAAW